MSYRYNGPGIAVSVIISWDTGKEIVLKGPKQIFQHQLHCLYIYPLRSPYNNRHHPPPNSSSRVDETLRDFLGNCYVIPLASKGKLKLNENPCQILDTRVTSPLNPTQEPADGIPGKLAEAG